MAYAYTQNMLNKKTTIKILIYQIAYVHNLIYMPVNQS